jgi:hypothetical protein
MTEPSNLAKNLSKSFADLICKVTDIEVKLVEALTKIANSQINNTVLSARISALEEKERQRDREAFQREQALDFANSEGLERG